MKDFELTPKMLSLGGVFYPTGYAFIMFPNSADAAQVARELDADHEDIMLLTPADILTQVGKADDESDVALPSIGTEGATVRKYVDLAREGHHALMIPAPSQEATERIMAVVRQVPFSYAQRYHMLVIEDLE
ncbi:MAG: RNA-binding protein [Polaromonas sp.]|jgi:hypothetical protein|nr:RNA-binding protein [Polaromonas sp.]